ncbi:protein FAM110C [Nothobranchius furzeri]|uniref:Family with sequence similarity 110 member C n=1 Tax=Nothobranchius furzeri TaxID=105023 RepID=A0A9D3C5G5_NOTFU|nr:family with sequence similarity 110 member C [Nothobranchius furzeri]
METNSGATRILGKGPEYLRKQMERESEPKGRVSAVERLAASKPKYVKSQQVVSSTQESAISSASVSGAESSNHNHVGTPLSGSNSSENTGVAQVCLGGKVDRSSSKKRRDSLQLYRQKCDLLQGAENDRKRLVSRRLQLISVNKGVPLPESLEKECESESNRKKMITPEETAKECGSRVVINQPEERSNGVLEESSDKCSNSGTAGGLLAVPDTERSGAKIGRSHSDISSRYSKSFADFDVFFKYCGLDGEVVESLGRENFSARSDEISINIRSVSISTSDDNFSKDSGDSDGLLQDELLKKKQQGTSVIERNARIIKWLYSCKNATETGKKLRDLN